MVSIADHGEVLFICRFSRWYCKGTSKFYFCIIAEMFFSLLYIWFFEMLMLVFLCKTTIDSQICSSDVYCLELINQKFMWFVLSLFFFSISECAILILKYTSKLMITVVLNLMWHGLFIYKWVHIFLSCIRVLFLYMYIYPNW